MGFLGGGEKWRRRTQAHFNETQAPVFSKSRKKHGIDQMFDAIQDELRSQYSIGYVSDEPVRISEWRSIQFDGEPQRDLVVQARRNDNWAQR